jgi:phospholipase/carboxylesterase
MKQAKLGELEVRITGGTDGDGGGAGPVVVLLHGFGAPGDDLVPLWRTLAVRRDATRTVRYVFPAAPIVLGPAFGEGRAWWWIDLESRMRRQAQGGSAWAIDEVPEGLSRARGQVDGLLDDVVKVLGPPPGKMVLGGFSQGAMLALDVALRGERPLAGLVLLSGTHIAAKEWAVYLDAGSRRGLPVFMSHGKQDPLLPFETAETLQAELIASGMEVEWHPFQGGHGIPPESPGSVGSLGAFLSRVTA